MRDRDRGRSSGDLDHPTAGGEEGDGSGEAGLAGLGTPPANIDSSGVPPIDIGVGAGSFDPELDDGSAGGLGTGLGDTRSGGAGGAAGVGSGASAKFATLPGVGAGLGSMAHASGDEIDGNAGAGVATDEVKAGDLATTSMGSDDPQDVDSDVASVRQSDLGSVGMGDGKGPGAGIGGSRGFGGTP
jgi:hypothetical protein